MRAKAVRLLILAAVCSVALWPPAVSHAWDYCPGQSCPFWRDVCEQGGGTFDQTNVGYCQVDEQNVTVLWEAVCTYDWRGPWYMSCTGI
jgi:hypothetical protein